MGSILGWAYWCPTTEVGLYHGKLPFEEIVKDTDLPPGVNGEWVTVQLSGGRADAALSDCSTDESICMRWDVLNDLDGSLTGPPQYFIVPKKLQTGRQYYIQERNIIVSELIRENRPIVHVASIEPPDTIITMEIGRDGELLSFSGIGFEVDRRDKRGACAVTAESSGLRLQVEILN